MTRIREFRALDYPLAGCPYSGGSDQLARHEGNGANTLHGIPRERS